MTSLMKSAAEAGEAFPDTDEIDVLNVSDGATVAMRPASGKTVAAPVSGDLPITVIRPTGGKRAIDFRELWRWRELLFFLTWRDLQVRYKQTVLGVGWAILQPLMTMVVFTIFFGRLGGMAKHAPPEIPYQVFVYASLLPWLFFSFALMHGGMSMIQSERLISKVYFPRLLLPASTVLTGLVDFFVSSTVLAAMMAFYGVVPNWNLLLLPLLIGGMALTALGAASLLASLAVAYRDFRYVIPFLAQLWMFSSPVAYPMKMVDPEWRRVYALNPMAGIIDGFSSALLGQTIHWDTLLISLSTGLVMLLVGLRYFRSAEGRFADIV